VRSTLRLGFAAATLAVATTSCVGYDQRVCDDLDTRACDHPAVPAQRLRDFRQRNLAARPTVGSAVQVPNVVVTAVDTYQEPGGDVGDVWVQERVAEADFDGCVAHPLGGRVCGMQLFSPTPVPAGTRLLAGDLVDVSGGRYDEFDCTPCCAAPRPPCRFTGRTLPELSVTNVTRLGSARPPDAIPVTLADITTQGDAMTGVLVRVMGEFTLTATRRPNEFDIGMGIVVTNQLTPLTDAQGMALVAGARVRNITGIVSYFFGTKLIPRSTMDYEVVP
jgi:hypothetical protein